MADLSLLEKIGYFTIPRTMTNYQNVKDTMNERKLGEFFNQPERFNMPDNQARPIPPGVKESYKGMFNMPWPTQTTEQPNPADPIIGTQPIETDIQPRSVDELTMRQAQRGGMARAEGELAYQAGQQPIIDQRLKNINYTAEQAGDDLQDYDVTGGLTGMQPRKPDESEESWNPFEETIGDTTIRGQQSSKTGKKVTYATVKGGTAGEEDVPEYIKEAQNIMTRFGQGQDPAVAAMYLMQGKEPPPAGNIPPELRPIYDNALSILKQWYAQKAMASGANDPDGIRSLLMK